VSAQPIARRRFLRNMAAGGAALLGGPALLEACSSSSKSTASATTTAGSPTTAAPGTSAVPGPLQKFSMQSAWVNDAEFIGYFIAITNGYYKDEGIDLNFLSGGPDVVPESSLLAKKAPLALTSPDTTITAIVNDGAPFVIVGTEYQKSPIGVVSLEKKPIHEPKDLIGKTLAVPAANTLGVDAMLKLSGIDKSKIKIVPYEFDPTPLLKGDIDASIDFVDDVPFTIEQAGEKAVYFLLYDYGYTVFNDTVVVTKDALAHQHETIVKWLRASRKGWAENFKDPTVYPPKFAGSYFKGTGRTIQNELFFNNAAKPLIDTPSGVFSMSEESIAANVKALNDTGIKATAAMFDTSLLAEI
jgi:ABC-type nitrate/sulfonate/bicarbonate transport system substrate-binding protein